MSKTTKIKCKKVKPVAFNSKMKKKFWFLMYLLLGLTLLTQFLLPDGSKHHFEVETYPFFYAIYGFISCVAIVIISKFLGIFFKRDENYYD